MLNIIKALSSHYVKKYLLISLIPKLLKVNPIFSFQNDLAPSRNSSRNNLQVSRDNIQVIAQRNILVTAMPTARLPGQGAAASQMKKERWK